MNGPGVRSLTNLRIDVVSCRSVTFGIPLTFHTATIHSGPRCHIVAVRIVSSVVP